MPFAVRKRKCTMGNGQQGSYVVVRTDTGKVVSCHKTKIKADQSKSIRDRASND